MTNIDLAVLVGYFIIVFLIAFWAAFRKNSQASSKNYFLGGKNIGWFVVGASLFASNIGSEHLVGLAGDGATSGIAVAQFEILAAFMLLALGWIFVPFYLKSGVYTMPEFLERRYSAASKYYLSTISIISYVLTKISVTILAGAIVFEVLLGIDFWTGALIIVFLTGIYTVFGGLRAVVYTDAMQMIILLLGSVAVTYIGLSKLGGWSNMLAIAEPGMMSLWKPANDPNYPWTGILFGAPILGIWYWCTDQFIVQRVLSAKDVSTARKATVFAGFLKMLPLFIFVIPGVIAYCLVQKGQLDLAQNDQALAALVTQLLPVGLKGLVAAGLLAALMSSLSSVFNSSSTLFTMDFYKKWKTDASDRHYVIVGQVATGILVILGILWVPFLEKIGNSGLFQSLQAIQAYIAPPIAAVFLLGVFMRRLNGTGAISALVIGGLIGFSRLILEILNKDGVSLPEFIMPFVELNFLYLASIIFIVSILVLVSVSFMTSEPDKESIENITFDYKGSSGRFSAIVRTPEFLWSVVLLVLVAIIWIVFR